MNKFLLDKYNKCFTGVIWCLKNFFLTIKTLLKLCLENTSTKYEEAFIKVVKLLVSILEADSVQLFHLQLFFFSQWNTRIEVYTVYR